MSAAGYPDPGQDNGPASGHPAGRVRHRPGDTRGYSSLVPGTWPRGGGNGAGRTRASHSRQGAIGVMPRPDGKAMTGRGPGLFANRGACALSWWFVAPDGRGRPVPSFGARPEFVHHGSAHKPGLGRVRAHGMGGGTHIALVSRRPRVWPPSRERGRACAARPIAAGVPEWGGARVAPRLKQKQYRSQR